MKTPIKFSDIPTPDTDVYKDLLPSMTIKGRTLFEHAQHLERQLARETEFGEAMAGEVVAIENALGFGGEEIPEPKLPLVLDRIRDLVAAEGELGDLREGVSGLMTILSSDLAADMGLSHPLIKAAVIGFQRRYLGKEGA